MDQTKPIKFQVFYSLEVEMKFFIQDLDRKRTNALRNLNQHKEITQYFFSLELTRNLHDQLIIGYEENHYVKSFDFSKAKARVRQIEDSSGNKTFLVGYKGSKNPELFSMGVTAKPELEIEISAERYEALKIQADQGNVSKTRVFHHFQANEDAFVLELDLIKKLNKQSVEPRFIIGEIELDEKKATQQIAHLRENSLAIEINEEINLALSEVRAGSSNTESTLVSNRKLLSMHKEHGIPDELREYF